MSDRHSGDGRPGGIVGRWRAALSSLRNRAGKRQAGVASALEVPPMARATQVLSILMFFVLGAGLTAFFLLNPLKISSLPSWEGEADAAALAASSPERTVYQCPMHPDVIEDKPGSCPLCGMTLRPVKGGQHESAQPAADHGHQGERKVLYWYAPMDPTYIRNEPGLSPMGMKLVPRYADEVSEGDSSAVVRIDPVQVQNIGLVSVAARRGDISRTIRAVGILDFDADKIVWINVKFSGWIEKVHVNYVGEEVHAGDPLFEIYSPDLVTTQEEYLRALEYRDSLKSSNRPEARQQARSLLRSTRERLTYWDITEEQIRELEQRRTVQRRLTVVSPSDGVVVDVAKEALEGMFVEPGMNLYRIADLSTVWAHADIYEQDMPWIYAGQATRVSLSYELDREYESKVLFLYPEVSRKTRTVKICVEIPNTDWKLRPGMYADVFLQGQTIHDAVLIPRSAILHSGERDIVFVDLGEGRFAPREITLGVSGGEDMVQVVTGIVPGEAVVTQAQFMLDSESRIQEAIAKFLERGTADAPAGAGDHEAAQTRPAHGE